MILSIFSTCHLRICLSVCLSVDAVFSDQTRMNRLHPLRKRVFFSIQFHFQCAMRIFNQLLIVYVYSRYAGMI